MEEFWKKYDKYIISDEWKALRKQAIHAQGRICQLTGIKLLRKETHVHHWIYRDNFSDSQLCDLSVLSEFSHYVIHDWIKHGHLDRATLHHIPIHSIVRHLISISTPCLYPFPIHPL